MNLLQKYQQLGALSGDPVDRLLQANGDVNVLRPFIGNDGGTYVTRVSALGRVEVTPVHNTHATLRKDEWKYLDDAIVKAAKERLKLVADIRGMGLTFTIPQGMGKTVLETETQGDVNDAVVSMDGLRESPDDRPEYELGVLPLPITHKDFMFSARQLLTSRNGGSPLDTSSAELGARKVAESNEKITLGVTTGMAYGAGSVVGLTNFSNRLTQVLTNPTAAGWTAATFLSEVMTMRASSVAAFHYGPWMLYVAPGWDLYLDGDFKAASDKTLRERVKAVSGITDIKTLDFLTGYQIVMVQMTSDIIRVVVGMDITTLQWDTKGGMQKNFKIMSIIVPQIRGDFNGNTGIVHGNVA